MIMVKFSLAFISVLYLYYLKIQYIYLTHSQDRTNKSVTDGQLVLLDFCSLKVWNSLVIHFYKKKFKNITFLHYDIQYVQTRAPEEAIEIISVTLKYRRK